MSSPIPAEDRVYRLTAAEILYIQPARPHILDRFVWQDYDSAPDFPELHRFLSFWASHMTITLHSVRIATSDEIRPEGYVSSSNAIH